MLPADAADRTARAPLTVSASSLVEALESRVLLSTVSFSNAPTDTVGDHPSAIAVGDLTGDGNNDLVVANSGTISVLLGNGNGTFQTEETLATNGSGSVAIADLNGDGNQDIIATGEYSVDVFMGNGNGTFQPVQSIGSFTSPLSVAVADLTGDGNQDIVVSTNNLEVNVLLGNGNGTFKAAQEFYANAVPVSVQIADLTGDGIPDIIVGNDSSRYPGVSILMGNGNGTFKAAQSLTVSNGLIDGVSVGDFNGDGNLDIAATDNDGYMCVFLNNGNGTFQAPQTYATDESPYGLTVADFTGDGRPDIAVVCKDGDDIDLFVNNGNGTFESFQRNYVGYFPDFVTSGDLNGDGRPDLIAANVGDNSEVAGSLSVLLDTSGPSPTIGFVDGIISVTGTGFPDTVSVSVSGSDLLVDADGQTQSFLTAGVTGIQMGLGAGNDTVSLLGVPVPATVGGAGGDDSITGGAGNDCLKGGAGDDTLGGAGGNDTVVGGGDDDSLKGGAGNDLIAGGPGNNTIHGGTGNDSIISGAGDNVVNGNAGNDTIVAGAGSSELFAGPGDDSIIGSTTAGDQPDSIYCGGSTDTILAGTDDSIFDTVAGDQITGGHIVN